MREPDCTALGCTVVTRPDRAPEWLSVPAVTRVQEDTPAFSPVGDTFYYKHNLLSTHPQLYEQAHKVTQHGQPKHDRFALTGSHEVCQRMYQILI